MTVFDEYTKVHKQQPKPTPIGGTWACPECGATNDQCHYDKDEGVVYGICEEHPKSTIYIGAGR